MACNSDGVGRDSPGALLDMLAEVASQTLHSEKKRIESENLPQSQPKVDLVKRKCQQEPSFDTSQLLSMPATQLLKQFSIFTSDELKRQYSYTCALVPGCGQRYTSFASEGRARMSIKAHLADHLDYLKRDKEAYSTFTAAAVKHQSLKPNSVSKKQRMHQPKNSGEALNKENKDCKLGKSTNYLRKILSSEMSFTEFEKQKSQSKLKRPVEPCVPELDRDPEELEFQVLGDHSYHEQVKVDNHQVVTPNLSEIMVKQAMGANIMLMVVESDGVHVKELPYIAQDISVHADQDETETIYLPESVTWPEDAYAKNMEMSVPAKPKGKAKFIGTSKEEREMALALMDRIKRKGNPAGGNLQCRICDPPRSFTAPTTLVSHYRSHAGIKPYECRICRAVFTRRHSLKYHMLIHQNQTRFTCGDCGKKFRHPSHFREHRRRHTGEAPFGCEDCGQRFKTRNTYKRHLKTRHGKVLTTTGELLHLSEEDFQKVRTNPKRRTEANYSASMIDEDVTAPETIMQFQPQNCQGNAISQCLEANYQVLRSDNKRNGTDTLWDYDNAVECNRIKEECYGDYEYCEESQASKTDYAKTDIAIDNCEFANVENVVSDSGCKQVKCETDCIVIGIREDEAGITDTRVLESDETSLDMTLETREKILYDENIGENKRNSIEYVQGINVMECGEDTIAYGDRVCVLHEEETNYDLQEANGQPEVDYFQDDLSIDNEIKYIKSMQVPRVERSNTEQYKAIQITEHFAKPAQINIPVPLQSHEVNNQNVEYVKDLVICCNEERAITMHNHSADPRTDSTRKQHQSKHLLDGIQLPEQTDKDETKTKNPNEFLYNEQSSLNNQQNS